MTRHEGKHSAHAPRLGRLTLHLPAAWPWREQFSAALTRLRALPSPLLA